MQEMDEQQAKRSRTEQVASDPVGLGSGLASSGGAPTPIGDYPMGGSPVSDSLAASSSSGPAQRCRNITGDDEEQQAKRRRQEEDAVMQVCCEEEDPVLDTHKKEDNGQTAFDDVTGKVLDHDCVKAAREEELAELERRGVYTKITLDERWRLTGRAPVGVRWIDTQTKATRKGRTTDRAWWLKRYVLAMGGPAEEGSSQPRRLRNRSS